MKRIAIVSLLGVLATPGSAQDAPALRTDLVISAAALSAERTDPHLVILQADRDTVAFAQGHLPGARLILLRAIVVDRDGVPNELPPLPQLDSVLEAAGVSSDSRVVIYGDPLAAARLFFTLDYLGFAGRASLLVGGLPAWRAEGLPISTAAPVVRRGHFDAHLRPELVISATELFRRLGDSALVFLDARAPAEYRGEVAGDGVPRPGHIPGAKGFFWHEALTGSEPARLREADELRGLLERVGLVAGKTPITYCRTGVQASYLYFIGRYLGYSPRLYDGSFSEWSRMPALPVER
ncbi:MAG: sulfurtransferase [bacterium]